MPNNHVEYIHMDGHQVEVEQESDGRIIAHCLCGIMVRRPSLIEVEEELHKLHLKRRIDRLNSVLERERNELKSSTQELIERLEDVLLEHQKIYGD